MSSPSTIGEIMKKPKLEIKWLDPKSLTPYQNNAKKHSTEQVDKIAGQIHKHGFDVPIVVDKDLVIIKGHGRREASLRLNLETVPVIVRDDLDEYEVMAARIADNKVAISDFDTDMLKFDLGTLQRQDLDLRDTGFDLEEAEKLLAQVDTPPDDMEDDDQPEEDKTQFIVAITCQNETDMQSVFEEMKGRGFSVTLIT